MSVIRIALVGLGKIARDQHVPALAGNPRFQLAAVASPHSSLPGIAHFPTLDALLEATPGIDAVSICTTPQVRYDIARLALECGRHVMLEKPPGVTVGEVAALAELARRKSAVLFATWHSREAAGVEPARRWLAQRKIHRVVITWREDVRVWHPGQAWLWKVGGLGVFDPGINALSIATRILPVPLVLREAELFIPSNCETPIAARLRLDAGGAPTEAELDFRQTGTERWDIEVHTDAGRLLLSSGGAIVQIGDASPIAAPNLEYPNLYARFATLVSAGNIEADATPLQLVNDALACGKRTEVEPFVP